MQVFLNRVRFYITQRKEYEPNSYRISYYMQGELQHYIGNEKTVRTTYYLEKEQQEYEGKTEDGIP